MATRRSRSRVAAFQGNPHRDPDPPAPTDNGGDPHLDPGVTETIDPGPSPTNRGGDGPSSPSWMGNYQGRRAGPIGPGTETFTGTRDQYGEDRGPILSRTDAKASLLAKQEMIGGLLGFAIGAITGVPAIGFATRLGMKATREDRERGVDQRFRDDRVGAHRDAVSLLGAVDSTGTGRGEGGEGPAAATTPPKEDEKPDESPFPFISPTTPTDYSVTPPEVQAGIPNFLAQAQADIRRARIGLRR